MSSRDRVMPCKEAEGVFHSIQRLVVESLRFTQSPASLPNGVLPFLFLCCPYLYNYVASSG